MPQRCYFRRICYNDENRCGLGPQERIPTWKQPYVTMEKGMTVLTGARERVPLAVYEEAEA
ncbi:MAG: hypothetical protein K6A39_05040, partial [Clostridiales bacterium]|nr:hypothetical protein [Clostridiales bacterium]